MEDPRHEPAGARHERAPGLDREAARPAVLGDAVEEGRQLPGEPLWRWRWLVQRHDREPTAQVDGVERFDRPAPQRRERERLADGVTPRIDGPELRPDVQVDAARAERPVRAAAGLDGRPDLGLGHAELGGTRPDGQPRVRLRRHVRVQPVQDVEAEPGLLRPAHGQGERLGLLRRFEGHPAQRVLISGGAGRVAQVCRRLADALQGDPLVRHTGAPRECPLPARHDIRPEAARRDLGDDGGHVVRLDRVLAHDRIRKGVAHARTRGVERREIGDEERRPVAPGSGPERLVEARLSPGRQAG